MEVVHQLLEAGADPNVEDRCGETPLLSVHQLLKRQLYSEAYSISCMLIYDQHNFIGCNHGKINVNATNKSGGTILFYTVSLGDAAVDITRLLLNNGATVWSNHANISTKTKIVSATPSDGLESPNSPTYNQQDDDSAFKWYLRSLMSGKTTIKSSKQTLYMLCTAMQSQEYSTAGHHSTMGQHIDRAMVELGVAPKLNGPLFRHLRSEIAPYITRPQSLRFICIKSIRKSIGNRQRQQIMNRALKRLKQNAPLQKQSNRHSPRLINNTAITTTTTNTDLTISNCKLKLPHKLQQFVCLEEMVLPN